jgi:hypothetical protein
MTKLVRLFGVLALVTSMATISTEQKSNAHSGGTDSSGCHTCRTNCPSYGLAYGEYHCHNPKNYSNNSFGSSGWGWTPTLVPSVCISYSATELTREDVALVQTILREKGYRPGPIDGYYGTKSRAALNRYESKWRLKTSKGSVLRNASLKKLGAFC